MNAYCFDFQTARRLFERHGYRLIGTAKDWPRGHEGYTLIKNLVCLPEESAVYSDAGFEIRTGSGEDGQFIADRLEEYNRSFVPRSHEYLDIDKKIVDGKGDTVAGCVAGVSGWDILHIDVLWVDDNHRGRGIGSYLLHETEREAKEKGACLSNAAGTEKQAAFFKKKTATRSASFSKTGRRGM